MSDAAPPPGRRFDRQTDARLKVKGQPKRRGTLSLHDERLTFTDSSGAQVFDVPVADAAASTVPFVGYGTAFRFSSGGVTYTVWAPKPRDAALANKASRDPAAGIAGGLTASVQRRGWCKVWRATIAAAAAKAA